MTQEFTTEVNLDHTNVFKRLTRYTIKPPGIIVDRHAPPSTGEPVIDPKGEWMKVQQLANIIALGGLMIVNEDLVEHLKDGDAQRALLRDLDALGYEDFDQVMTVLTKYRDEVVQPREFEIWSVGYRDTGIDQPPSLIGKATARNFEEACRALYNQSKNKGSHEFNDWKYDETIKGWRNFFGRLCKSELEAQF